MLLIIPLNVLFWGSLGWGFYSGDWGLVFKILGGIFAVVLVAGAIMGNSTGGASSTIKTNTSPISTSILIERPVGSAWNLITTKEKWASWWPSGISSITPGWTNGAIIHWDAGDESVLETVKRPYLLRIRGAQIELEIALAPSGKGTSITFKETPIGGSRWTDGGFSRLAPLDRCLQQLKSAAASLR